MVFKQQHKMDFVKKWSLLIVVQLHAEDLAVHASIAAFCLLTLALHYMQHL